MWIEYIEEIGIAFFILMIAIHFAQHFKNKAERIKRDKLRQQKQESET